MDFRALASKVATEVGVDPAVFTRLVQNESSFNPNAKSKKGATGLAQLMPDTARELGVDINDPEQNLRGGATYFKQQIDRFGSPELALAAYNAGPEAVQKAGGIPDFPETKSYVQKIMGGPDKLPTAEELWSDFDVAGQTPNKGVTVFTPKNEPSDSTELPSAKEPSDSTKLPSAKELWATFGEEKPNALKPNTTMDALKGGASGLIGGIAGIAGQGGDLERQIRGTVLNSALNIGNAGANLLHRPGITPQAMQNIQALSNKAPTIIPSSQPVMQDTQSMFGSPQTKTGKYIHSIATMAPAVLGGEGGIIARGLRAIVPGVASEAAGQMTQGKPYEQAARIAGALAGGAGSGVVEGMGARMAADKANTASTPAIDALKTQSGELYEKAKSLGVVVKPDNFKQFSTTLAGDLKKEGIDKTLTPAASRAIVRIQEVTKKGEPVSFDAIDTLRKVASIAGESVVKADRRMGRIIVDKIDDYVDSLTPKNVISGDPSQAASTISAARDLWKTASKSSTIKDVITKAEANAGDFNIKLDTALRNQFKKLSNNERGMSRFNPVEQEAIKKAASSGTMSDILHMVGNLAPTNLIKAGIEGSLGHFTGGIGYVVPVAGAIAKSASIANTTRNARLASELVRRGGKTPNVAAPVSMNPAMIAAALASRQQGQTQ